MKYLLHFFIFFILTATHLFAQNKWEQVTKINHSLRAVSHVDTNTIYVISSQNAYSFLQKTINQWESWDLLKKNDEFSDTLRTSSISYISTPDDSNVYIIFSRPFGYIYHSSDGGNTFNKIKPHKDISLEIINMRNNNVGVVSGSNPIYALSITKDGWQSVEEFHLPNEYSFINPGNIVTRQFINDSTIGAIIRKRIPNHLPNSNSPTFFLKLNIYTQEYNIYKIDFLDKGMFTPHKLHILDENTYYIPAKGYLRAGGSGHDMIYKTTDGGQTWRCILDLNSDSKKFGLPTRDLTVFGLQSIDFKDSLHGIATGQFGKIVYTYDGGESWIYENNMKEIRNLQPPVFQIHFAGATPFVYGFSGQIFKLTEDNLAPKQSDTITICGRVTHNGEGMPLVPIAIGLRITMTDSLGYYKFAQLPAGTHTVKALNKYFDYEVFVDAYRPYIFSPDSVVLTLTADSCGVDFEASSNFKYYTLSGLIVDTLQQKPLEGITVRLNDLVSVTDENGIFTFPDLESHIFYLFEPESDEYLFYPPQRANQLVQDTTGTILQDATGKIQNMTGNVFIAYKPTYSISGTVYDSTTKMPLSGITISMGDKSTTSDAQGQYIFSQLPPEETYNIAPNSDVYQFYPLNYEVALQQDTSGLDFAGYYYTSVKGAGTDGILRQEGSMLIVSEAYTNQESVITVSDINGRQLLKAVATDNLSLENLSRGRYIVSLTDGVKIIATLKVLVE